jgi:predicted  nucleic acid-binding Zn-ribbon protein
LTFSFSLSLFFFLFFSFSLVSLQQDLDTAHAAQAEADTALATRAGQVADLEAAIAAAKIENTRLNDTLVRKYRKVGGVKEQLAAEGGRTEDAQDELKDLRETVSMCMGFGWFMRLCV